MKIRDNRSNGGTHQMPDRIRLDGKVAVVTGAAGVIGTATMHLLAERGARIVAVDRKAQDLQTAIKDLPASAEALAVTADVTAEDEVADYVRATLDRFGTIDAFYNNAGVEGDIKPIVDYSLEAFRRVLDVNVVGVFLGMKHVLPVMLKHNKGSIINTASIAGLMGSPHIAVYSASKHAVIGLTKTAAWECTGTNVRVNCVCPGLIDSRMLSAIIDGRGVGNVPMPHEKIVERIPARRLGQASEVASIVAFLASDEASYVTGSHYTVDGGRTAA
jgi:NAD(P)-dependent dehydrogenase (short-subunit alcohol dehydrogenase family)